MQKLLPQGSSIIGFDNLPNSAYVRLPVLISIYGVSSATIWRNVKNGNIPKPHKLTARTTVWNVGELRASLAAKGALNAN